MARSRCALLLLLATCGLSGCSTFARNTEIVQLDLSQDTQRAMKLTRGGIRHYHNGHVKKAEAEFEKAIAADETYGPAHNNLGLLYFDQRDLYLAAWAFERAAEFMPERAEPVNNLGMTYEAAGRLEQAIEMFYTAHEIEPTNPEYLGNLTRARMRRGDRDEALVFQLRELLFLERRPDWVAWAEDQLALTLRQEALEADGGSANGEDAGEENAIDEDNGTPELLPPTPSDAAPAVPDQPARDQLPSDQPPPEPPMPNQPGLIPPNQFDLPYEFGTPSSGLRFELRD